MKWFLERYPSGGWREPYQPCNVRAVPVAYGCFPKEYQTKTGVYMQWILKKIIGTKNQRDLKKIHPRVDQINAVEEQLQSISDDELKAKTAEFKQRIEAGETVDDLLVEAFAVVKNACRRLVGQTIEVSGNQMTWDMVPFDTQLIGGIVLHEGKIAEMATGEGKTLVATLPVYLNALSGKGVHVVTVNDYLARRDSEWMGTVYTYLGLTVGCIQNSMRPDVRREEYNKDITYGTNAEFGFDYLRDNMAMRPSDMVQREHHYAVVDEITAAHPAWKIEVYASEEQMGQWDAARISQALTNLMVNAVEHGSPGTTVKVELGGDERDVAISIHNFGTAISADLLNGIFNPMKCSVTPLLRSTHGPTGNLGLGLYIAERIIDAHGGRIEVDSSEARGTTFMVHLPRSD